MTDWVRMHAEARVEKDRGRAEASAWLRQKYRQARELQAAAQRALGPRRSFVEWLLLETIAELTKEHGEAVTQNLVATHSGLSRKVVSYWVCMMDDLGFVNRGELMDGRCWGVLLTQMGKDALAGCNERLEAAGVTR
jgi:RIO-like serine/threonine protein kinase